MHYVGQIDWSFIDRPAPASATSSGLTRLRIVGPGPGGGPHRAGRRRRCSRAAGWRHTSIRSRRRCTSCRASCCSTSVGTSIGSSTATSRSSRPAPARPRATRAAEPVRLLSLNSAAAARPDERRGATRSSSRPRTWPPWTPPRPPAVRRPDAPTRRPLRRDAARSSRRSGSRTRPTAARPAGMDTAILAYSGISVKMLVDRTFGADQVTMFTVDYELGGAAQAHDHPFEEAYVFLAGEIEGELDGQHYTLPAGRRRLRRRRLGPRLLQHRHRTRPLDRDAGAPAAGPARLSLGRPWRRFEEG